MSGSRRGRHSSVWTVRIFAVLASPRRHSLRLNLLGVIMFGLGVPELVILAVIVLLLFGRRLPGVFHSLGQSLPAFKKGLTEDDSVAPRDYESAVRKI